MLELYNRILKQTTRLGITGTELGTMLGLKKSPLTDWKNQKSNPTLEQLILMCDIFAVSSDYLLFGKTDSLSTNETILLEKFNSLDASGQADLLDYAQYRVFQNTKKTNSCFSNESEDGKLQGRYTTLNRENSDNIIA